MVAALLAAAGLAAAPSPQRWLAVDPAHRSVRITLVAGYDGSNNGFNFDGYSRGRLLVTVPRGWRVTVDCRNRASERNSCAVVEGAGTSRLAFRGASTPDPFVGLFSGASAAFSFTPAKVGTYRLVSLVAGHAGARQYVVLDVARGGRPSISIL